MKVIQLGVSNVAGTMDYFTDWTTDLDSTMSVQATLQCSDTSLLAVCKQNDTTCPFNTN